MELLDRYLQAVRKYLPRNRQEDIIAELRANLESQLEERQSELGRPLTAAEAEAWVGKLGSPLQMASQYQPQQCLIGPGFFPIYVYVLRVASMWAIIIYTIVAAVTTIFGSPSMSKVAEAVMRLPSLLIQVAAWVTLIFAVFEFVAARFPGKLPPLAALCARWSPGNLPLLEPARVRGKKARSYAQAVAEVIFGFLALGWLLMVPEHPYLMFGPGLAYLHASPFRIATLWLTFYWWIVGLNAFQLAWRCIDLLRGTWQWPDRAQQIAVTAFGLIPLVLMINVPGHAYVLLRRPDADLVQYGQTLDSINQWIYVGLGVIAAIAAIQLAWDISRAIAEWWRKSASAR